MTRNAFTGGLGAIVSASRSILYAHKEMKIVEKYGADWEKCVEARVIEMKADLSAVLST